MDWVEINRGSGNFYVNSTVCVRVGNGMSDWFPVKVGLCQGSVNFHLTYLMPIWMVL